MDQMTGSAAVVGSETGASGANGGNVSRETPQSASGTNGTATKTNETGSAGGNGAESGQKPGETKAEAAVRKLKAIIDGKEVEVDESAAIRALQKEKASDKRFMEASKMRKQAESLIEQIKRGSTDPKIMAKIMKELGGDFKTAAEKYLYEIIKEEQLTPEQKQFNDMKRKIEEHEEQERLRNEDEQTQQAQLLQAKYTKEYQTDIISALDKSGLPKTEYTIARMARYMHMGLQRGVELKASDVVDFVWKDYGRDLGAMKSLPMEKLMEVLGPELADRIRKNDLEKVRGGAPGSVSKPDTNPTQGARSGGNKPLTREEFRARVEQRASQ